MKIKAAKKKSKKFISKGVSPYQMAFTLLIPLRNIFLSPDQLVKRLELKRYFRVMEVGPGPGYFSVRIAQALQEGHLVPADIQQKMPDYSKRRLQKRNCTLNLIIKK